MTADERRKDDIMAEDILRLVDTSVKMEWDRGKSLAETSTRLLTCISVLSVAFLSLLSPLCDAFEGVGKQAPILLVYIAVFGCLAAAFICSLMAQFRFKYKKLRGPKEIVTARAGDVEWPTRKDAAIMYVRELEEHYESTAKKNDRIAGLIMATSVLLTIALGIEIIGAGVLYACWVS